MSYKAFLSYSHAADVARAPAIHSALHRFAKPWYRLRAIHVFRDQTNLAATPELWPTIQAALDDSEYFVLLASPDAAGSKWVAREIEHWCATKSATRIIIVVTAGTVVWDEMRSDFDWQQTTALPHNLSGRFATEPLWVDLSWATKSEEFSLRHLRFRDAIATIAAPLHGKSKEKLDGEDVRQHKKTWLVVRSVIVVLVLLVAIAFWQFRVAEGRRRVGLSRQLAAQAATLLDDRYDRAVLLGAQAFRFSPTLEARNALFTALASAQHASTFLRQDGTINRLAFDAGGTLLIAGGDDIVVWDVAAHAATQTIATKDSFGNRFSLALSPSEDLLIRSTHSGVVLWNVKTQRAVSERFDSAAGADSVAISADGRLVAFLDAKGSIQLRHRATGAEAIHPIAARLEPHDRIVFSRDGRVIAAATGGGRVLLWRLADPSAPPQALQVQFMPSNVHHGGAAPQVIDVGFAGEDGATLLVGTDDGVRLWDFKGDRVVGDSKATRTHPADAAFDVDAYAVSADGRILAAGFTDGSVRVWNVVEGTALPRPLAGYSSAVRSVALSRDGSRLAAGHEDGVVRVWDLSAHSLGTTLSIDGIPVAFVPRTNHLVTVDRGGIGIHDGGTGALLKHLPNSKSFTAAVTVDPRGTHLAAGSSDGVVRMWDLPAAKVAFASLPNRIRRVMALAFSRNGETLAAGDDQGHLVTWQLDPKPRAIAATVGTSKFTIWSIAFSSDGKRVLAGTSYGTAVWNPSTGETQRSRFGAGLPTAFNADATLLASHDSDKRLQFWRVGSGAPIEPPIASLGVVNDLGFSPNGELFAASDGSGSVFLWDVATGQRFGPPLFRKKGAAFHFAFRGDSGVLAVEEEGVIVLWDLLPESWLRRVRSIANRNLTAEEWRRYIPDDSYEKTFADLP
jgi:WD40 repeat protein